MATANVAVHGGCQRQGSMGKGRRSASRIIISKRTGFQDLGVLRQCCILGVAHGAELGSADLLGRAALVLRYMGTGGAHTKGVVEPLGSLSHSGSDPSGLPLRLTPHHTHTSALAHHMLLSPMKRAVPLPHTVGLTRRGFAWRDGPSGARGTPELARKTRLRVPVPRYSPTRLVEMQHPDPQHHWYTTTARPPV